MKARLIIILAGMSIGFVGCKKNKIEKNLNETWTLSGLFIGGVNEVTQNTSHTLEFVNVDKGEGNATLVTTDAVSSYYMTGTVTLNDDYSHADITLNDGTYQIHWDADMTVDESSLTLSGTHTDNVGSPAETLLINGFR